MDLNEIRCEERIKIPMSDGTVLEARAWFPVVEGRVPAVIALQPYQKDGRSRVFLPDAMHRFLARRGMGTLMVDIRGTGASEGVSRGPFGEQEAKDGFEVVEWAASQPWCTGRVGMWGVSYPGLTSLATAALSPPSLKAIVPVHACGDPDRDFVRLAGREGGYWFGAEWGPRMIAYNLMPPLLQRGEEWEEAWRTRLQDFYPWVLAGYTGLDQEGHPTEEVPPFGVESIQCASLHIVGWRDLFAGPTIRDWRACQGPKRLVVGPWKHSFPDTDPWAPAPLADEIAQWFTYWLNDSAQAEAPAEPPVAFYVQSDGSSSELEGWYSDAGFPSRAMMVSDWWVDESGVLGTSGGARNDSNWAAIPEWRSVGLSSVVWDGWTAGLDPQRARNVAGDDALSLTATSATLVTPLVVGGEPELEFEILELEAGSTCVRLLEVTADGRSVLITRGWVSDSGVSDSGHRLVRARLAPTAYVLPPGSSLRIAISASDFPTVWPDPLENPVHVDLATLRLFLPVVPSIQLVPHAFPGRVRSEELAPVEGCAASASWNVVEDLTGGTKSLVCVAEDLVPLVDSGWCRIVNRYEVQVSDDGQSETRMQSETVATVEQGDSLVTVTVGVSTTESDVNVSTRVERNGDLLMNRSWRKVRTSPAIAP
jgi:uncharacterized protein